ASCSSAAILAGATFLGVVARPRTRRSRPPSDSGLAAGSASWTFGQRGRRNRPTGDPDHDEASVCVGHRRDGHHDAGAVLLLDSKVRLSGGSWPPGCGTRSSVTSAGALAKRDVVEVTVRASHADTCVGACNDELAGGYRP